MKKVPKLNKMLVFFDFLLMPIMFVLSGFKTDSIQKTHGWHLVSVNPKDLNKNLCVLIKGEDNSKALKSKNFYRHFGHFHMPIFGGFRNYAVLESTLTHWYLGWFTKEFGQFSKLPINGKYVKVLSGKKGTATNFFALNKNGEQIKLKYKSKGKIGDYKFKDIPLY